MFVVDMKSTVLAVSFGLDIVAGTIAVVEESRSAVVEAMVGRIGGANYVLGKAAGMLSAAEMVCHTTGNHYWGAEGLNGLAEALGLQCRTNFERRGKAVECLE